MTALLVPPTTSAPYLSTHLTNQLEPSILSSKSQKLNSQVNQLQQSTWIKPSRSVINQMNTSLEGVEVNIISSNDAFDGYNLFKLTQINRTDPKIENRPLVVTNMEGDLIWGNENISFPIGTWVAHCAKFINSTTFLFGTKRGATLWNIYDNTTAYLGFRGHHDYEYNPLNNTIFTFNYYTVEIEGHKYIFDTIEEYDLTGHLVWSIDTRSFISHTQWCPFRDLFVGERGITNSNSLFFDPDEEVLFYNARNLNTFYKIDHKTGQVHWGLGEYGNFTLYDWHGNQRRNLFYHAHAVEKVDDDTFFLFDNDYHNQTNPNNQRSRLLEITINEATMTANESWVWVAPSAYYSTAYGDADRLPNGNRLGTFGYTHPSITDIGARVVEVNATGQIVWEMNFSNTEEFLNRVNRLERFRLTPILSSPPDIRATSRDNVTVSWQTWYNFRSNRRMRGTYTLYLDGKPIEYGSHVFDKYWRPTNLNLNLGKLEAGNHSCMLILADEAGHITKDSLNIYIFYFEREGPLTTELGQENARIHWKGYTPNPLWATLTVNNTLLDSFVWNGSVITLDLNSFDVGVYQVTLKLFYNTKLFYEDSFLATIYPVAVPTILSFPEDQSLTWNESFVFSWELFDHLPGSWNIFVNGTLTAWGSWETPSYLLIWNVPVLDEGLYNITLVAFDRVGHQTARTMWLTVVPPSPPVIVNGPQQTEFQWGEANTSLTWEVHGGTHWTLWINGTAAYSGKVTSTCIEVQVENRQQEDWWPDTYNLTLQVIDESGAIGTRTSWIRVSVDPGDAYADSIITGVSMWYWDGENALGPPDGKFTRLYLGYGNGHVTLDMGSDEEILDENGIDFTVYARGGEYAVFIGNNLSALMLVENQVSAPLVLLGVGIGNTSFDLADSNLTQARYIQIVYLKGENVELDAVVAVHFNQPPKPALNFERWMFPVLGTMFALSVMVAVIWVRRRKR